MYSITKLRASDGTDKYEVHGGSSVYFLYPRPDGSIRCTCPGYRYNGRCKHQGLAPVSVIRYPLATMTRIASQLLEELRPIGRMDVCGSVRRSAFTCKDLDFIVLANIPTWDSLIPELGRLHNGNWKVGKHGSELISGHICGIPVDFTRVGAEREWPFMALYRTGSRETNIRMRGRAKGWGWKLNERGLYDTDGSLIECEDEEEIFSALDLKYLSPCER